MMLRVSEYQLRTRLRDMSDMELAVFQNMVVGAADMPDRDRRKALRLVGEEVRTRQSEGLSRKGGRFIRRHGETITAVGLGALLGIGLD